MSLKILSVSFLYMYKEHARIVWNSWRKTTKICGFGYFISISFWSKSLVLSFNISLELYCKCLNNLTLILLHIISFSHSYYFSYFWIYCKNFPTLSFLSTLIQENSISVFLSGITHILSNVLKEILHNKCYKYFLITSFLFHQLSLIYFFFQFSALLFMDLKEINTFLTGRRQKRFSRLLFFGLAFFY